MFGQKSAIWRKRLKFIIIFDTKDLFLLTHAH